VQKRVYARFDTKRKLACARTGHGWVRIKNSNIFNLSQEWVSLPCVCVCVCRCVCVCWKRKIHFFFLYPPFLTNQGLWFSFILFRVFFGGERVTKNHFFPLYTEKKMHTHTHTHTIFWIRNTEKIGFYTTHTEGWKAFCFLFYAKKGRERKGLLYCILPYTWLAFFFEKWHTANRPFFVL